MESPDETMQLFTTIFEAGEDQWTAHEDKWVNAGGEDPASHSLKFWTWKETLPSSTQMRIKQECVFPNIEPEKLFEILSNIEIRLKWDERWEKGEILEQDGDVTVFWGQSPKPPIPMVSAREMVTKGQRFENWKEG
jgi:hypothetical protein